MTPTWPIACFQDERRTLLRLPDRTGDGDVFWDPDATTLEQIAGDRWIAEILACLLTPDRAWSWWTQSKLFERSGLAAEPAADVVEVARLQAVRRRKLFWKGMTLAFIPAADRKAQETVRSWAGTDTEQLPDVIWTASDASSIWKTDRIVSWCGDRALWSDPGSIGEQPAERIVLVYDSDVFCALPSTSAETVRAGIEGLAKSWGVEVIGARAEFAWVTPPRKE